MPTVNDQVRITKTYREDHWVVQAELLPVVGGVLPTAVFIHENTGSATLGGYWGVCSLEELERLKVWEGTPIKKFGNRFVRHSTAEKHLTPGANPDITIKMIRTGLENLRREMQSGAEVSTVYPIP